MTANDVTPGHDGEDLAQLREEIDELKATPVEDLIDPTPRAVRENEPTPEPTDAIGSEEWDEPAGDEVTDL